MSTMKNDGWIKMSDRQPERGTDIWTYYPAEANYPERVTLYENVRGLALNATHWKPAHIPAPPKKEPTQREEDEKASTDWYNTEWPKVVSQYEKSLYGPPPFTTNHVWHAALAYRDAQNREDLEKAMDVNRVIYGSAMVEALSRIRRRCGLHK